METYRFPPQQLHVVTGAGGRMRTTVSERDIQQSDPAHLARMMAMAEKNERVWRPDELGAVLRHQLGAPVQLDLGNFNPGDARRLATLGNSQGLLLKSFSDLFHHPQPPIELLEMVKQFAKTSRSHPDSPLPREIATLLYYAAIVVAMTRCGRRITNLDDAGLKQGIGWVLNQNWIDDRTRGIFTEGLELIDAQVR